MSKKLLYIPTYIFVSIFYSFPVSAQGNLKDAAKNLKNTADKAGTAESELQNIVGIAIGAALTLVGLFFLILMVYAGFLWMTARGESDQVDKARKIIVGSIIGLVIVLSAYAITVFVTKGFV